MPQNLILKTLSIHGLITILLSLSVYFNGGTYNAMSCLVGCLLMGMSLLALVWAWQQIFNKKLIALAVGVIVSKYAILGSITYYLVVDNKVDFMSFLIGCSSMPLSAFAMLSLYRKVQTVS